MPAYDGADFDPPAPIVHALVRGLDGGQASDALLLLDTGADVSVVPRVGVEGTGTAVRRSNIAIEGYGGGRALCDLADLEVEILGYGFKGAYVVGDAAFGIVGRDILNLLVLQLNGPGREWSVL